MREQAAEALTHAQQAGEMITLLGEYPSLTIGPLLDTYQHDVEAIMRESLESEAKALALYCDPKAPKALLSGRCRL
jgi:bacterioferritin